jgi:uncharacterized protein DUF4255
MIHLALKFLKDQVNSRLHQEGEPDDILLTAIVNDKGEYNFAPGQIGISAINIEEEKFLKAQPPAERRTKDTVQFANPEIRLNVFMMLAANPGKDFYEDALRKLSEAIFFFQGINVFERTNFPALDPRIEKLIVDLYTLSFEQQNQLWGSLGAKYIPSVIYKVRLLVIDDKLFGAKTPLIKTIESNVHKIED